MSADTAQIAAYFDDLGTGEWDRLDETLHRRIKYANHRRFLLDAIRPNMRVLDSGCGPGRFALDLARAGARVTPLDLSAGQLVLATDNLDDAVQGDAVEQVIEGDLRQLPDLGLEPFDAVVCYGGVVSYARAGYADALSALAHVARPRRPS